MTGVLKPITALLLAAAILLTGNGLFGVLVPIRADFEQFSRLGIGLLGSGYFLGLVTGCLVCPRVIGRVGHIRAFVAFTAVATVTPLLHALWIDASVWFLLRVFNGVCFAGLFMGIESWLTSTAESNTRGRILAGYTLINLTVVTLGMQMIALAPISGFQLFSLVAVLYSLAAVPIALTGSIAPPPPVAARLQLGRLLSISPAAVLGCLCAGFANAAFWSLAPLYGKAAGLSVIETATMLTFAVLAGALAQWPVGALSDRIGRRIPLIATSVGAALAGIALFAFVGAGRAVIFTLAALYGSCSFLIYTMAVAHANDLVPRERAVEVSSGLLLTFSGAAVVGPLVAAFVMAHLGAGALFLHTAAAHLVIALVLLVRVRLRPDLPVEESEAFVYVPRTTPAVFGLDPRTEPAAEQASDDSRPSEHDDQPQRAGSGSRS